MVDMLNEKIGIFTKTAALVYGSTSFNKPADLYRLTAIEYNGIMADRLTRKEFLQINKSPLTKPSNDFPVYTELTIAMMFKVTTSLTIQIKVAHPG